MREVVFNEGLEKIGDVSFQNCKSLESINLPSSVTDIGYLAFDRCSALKEVVLSEGLKKIGEFAFSNCSSLESINLPSTLIKIDNFVFSSCVNLREVVCIEGLPRIGEDIFSGCLSLERITFPNLSSHLEDIIRAGQVDAQNKVQQSMNRGEIEWRRGGTIYIPVEVTRRRDGWDLVKQRIDQIIKWIRYYSMKEATTLFELALWKAKIDQAEDDIFACDRGSFRVDVPGPVKDTIIQYLDV